MNTDDLNTNDVNSSNDASNINPEGENMMNISKKQLIANRLNGLKSNGPKTKKGKAMSSMNALTHGVFQNNIFSESTSLEDLNLYDSLYWGLVEAWHPVGMAEDLSVKNLALCYLKYYRLNRYEFELTQIEIEKNLPFDDEKLTSYLERTEKNIKTLMGFDQDPIAAVNCLAGLSTVDNGVIDRALQNVEEKPENPEALSSESQKALRSGVFKLADNLAKEVEEKRKFQEKAKRMAFVNAFLSDKMIAKLSKYGGPIERSIFQTTKHLIMIQDIRKKQSGEM
jgi:hypothetical protein